MDMRPPPRGASPGATTGHRRTMANSMIRCAGKDDDSGPRYHIDRLAGQRSERPIQPSSCHPDRPDFDASRGATEVTPRATTPPGGSGSRHGDSLDLRARSLQHSIR